MPSRDSVNNDYNLITNEYCKSIDDENKCQQLTQCSWKTDKCLLNIHDTGEPGETNLLTDNVYLYHYVIQMVNISK